MRLSRRIRYNIAEIAVMPLHCIWRAVLFVCGIEMTAGCAKVRPFADAH